MSPARRRGRLALAGALVPALLAGCAEDPAQAYCAAVEERQGELGELVGDGGPDALLAALGIFTELRAEAPGDLADEWTVVVERLEGLDAALADAGVGAADYDRDTPPAGLSADERAAIDAAATALGDPETASALAGLEQQARDVCHTPLVL